MRKSIKSIRIVRFSLFLSFLLINACSINIPHDITDSGLTLEDIGQLQKIKQDYVSGWLENDSQKVLSLYSDSAIIIPSGLGPIEGKEAIRDFWFPNDSSTTKVHGYNLEILEISGMNSHAYSYERGNLSFTYQKGNFRMDRDATSYAITTYEKTDSEVWMITKRIWTDIHGQ